MPPPPANSGFPSTLIIGQPPLPAPAEVELDINHPITSSQHIRFRDRDEYLWDMLKGGAAAPEPLNLSALAINTVPIVHPATDFVSGLSTANGSFRLETDLKIWAGFSFNTFQNVHFRTFTFSEQKYFREIMINCNFAILQHQDVAVINVWRLVVNNVEVARCDLSQPRHASYGPWLGHSGSLSWAGVWGPGVNWYALQLSTWIKQTSRAIIQANWSPASSVYMV